LSKRHQTVVGCFSTSSHPSDRRFLLPFFVLVGMVPPVVHGVILLYLAITVHVAVAWVAPPFTRGGNYYLNNGRSSSVRATIAVTPRRRLAAAAPVVPNPFQKLPWNVRKEQEREARRLKLERVKLHRQLGIAEDATYEEIVFATDRLIAEAGSNMKQKVLVEVAKDKILQYRLSERLAGYVKANAEARAQSVYELEGYVERDKIVAVPAG
jgi:Protein CHAPERONE-LIKE PROTEIN OF POR1-like